MKPNPQVVINRYSNKNWRNWKAFQLGPERVKILMDNERKVASKHRSTMFVGGYEDDYYMPTCDEGEIL